MQYNCIYIMSYKFYINIYRKVLTHAIYHDIVISTNKKAGDTYQANTGTPKNKVRYKVCRI